MSSCNVDKFLELLRATEPRTISISKNAYETKEQNQYESFAT